MSMHSFKHLQAFLLAALVLAVSPAVALTASDLERLDSEFKRVLEADGVPGAAWSVVRGGHLVHVNSYGVRVNGLASPVTPSTVFRVASVSKTFAAQLTAMMVAEGRLDWDDPVISHVPGFRLADPAHSSELRIHHLLGQSVGVVPNAYDNLVNANQSLDRILPRFAELEPICLPGQCYTYQNVLFALVGPALEQATGLDYDSLLTERVLRPLGMVHASSGLDGYLASDNRAAPHVRRSRNSAWFPTQVTENYYRVSPAAGVNASAIDLGLWLSAQMGHSPDIVDPMAVRVLTEPRIRTVRDLRRRGWRDLLDNAHYGLGWRIYSVAGEPIFLHSGWVRGFVAEIAWSPSRQVGLAVLINAESPALNDITTYFWREMMGRGDLVVDATPIDPSAEPATAKGGD
ncbi:MAG: class A beta-lactamase-related serine hydrolase [Wenzhouxiangella sp.]|nr:MAG: class A beta-lactamase-related serine hydrolase [Wenzhouxiangella sp.]